MRFGDAWTRTPTGGQSNINTVKRRPRMIRALRFGAVLLGITLLAWQTPAQEKESKAAQTTRMKLQQVIGELNIKDIGTKEFFEDVNRELDKTINFKIDNASGVSNNTKL